MGVETVPCLIWKQREAFTGNRMVNQLSARRRCGCSASRWRSWTRRRSPTPWGWRGSPSAEPGPAEEAGAAVVKAFEAGKMNLQCAKELAHVKPERQAEILKLMESCNDYSVTFAKGLVLKTPVAKRAKVNGATTPWTRADEKKSDLLKKLREAEQQQDFYSGLYRQYTTNLLKLVIYVRSLLANERVQEYLRERTHSNWRSSSRSSTAPSGDMGTTWSRQRVIDEIHRGVRGASP